MKIHYYVREYSESVEFPDVVHFVKEWDCVWDMVDGAFASAEEQEGYVATEMDGEPVERHMITSDCTDLYVQLPNEGVECWKRSSFNLEDLIP